MAGVEQMTFGVGSCITSNWWRRCGLYDTRYGSAMALFVMRICNSTFDLLSLGHTSDPLSALSSIHVTACQSRVFRGLAQIKVKGLEESQIHITTDMRSMKCPGSHRALC